MNPLAQSILVQSPLLTEPAYSAQTQFGNFSLPHITGLSVVHCDLKTGLEKVEIALSKALEFYEANRAQTSSEDLNTYYGQTNDFLTGVLKAVAKRIKKLELKIFQQTKEISGLHASFFGNIFDANKHLYGATARLDNAKNAVPPKLMHFNLDKNSTLALPFWVDLKELLVQPQTSEASPSELPFLTELKSTLAQCIQLKERVLSAFQKFNKITTNQSLDPVNAEIVSGIFKQEDKKALIAAEKNKVYNMLQFELNAITTKAEELKINKDQQLEVLNKLLKIYEKARETKLGLNKEVPQELENKLASLRYTILQVNKYYSELMDHRLVNPNNLSFYQILAGSENEIIAKLTEFETLLQCKIDPTAQKPLTNYALEKIEAKSHEYQLNVAQFKEEQLIAKSCFDKFTPSSPQLTTEFHQQQYIGTQASRKLGTDYAALKEKVENRIDTLNDQINKKGMQIKELTPILIRINSQLSKLNPLQEKAAGGWAVSVVSSLGGWFGSQSPATSKKEEAVNGV